MKREKDKKKYDLLFDVGNTNTKIGFASNGEVVHSTSVSAQSPLPELPSDTRVIVSNVRNERDHHLVDIRNRFPHAVWLNAHTPLFFATKTKRRDTIGPDRLAACAGALTLGKNGMEKLVITTGTCVTYNYIDSDGAFAGGAIAPGFQMRLDAMHHFTGKLPKLIAEEGIPPSIGKDTEENLHSGVYFGIRDEIDGRISRFIGVRKDYEIFITGGHHLRLVNQSKYSIFANSNLQLIGLLKILELQP